MPDGTPAARPALTLAAGHDGRARAGHPWVFSNELAWNETMRRLPPGGLARLTDARGAAFGTWMFNPHSLIAARLLSRDPDARIDAAFLGHRLHRAAALRARFFAAPYHRLVHAEADGLPGLVIDRYGDVFAVQANSAGIDRLLPELATALAAFAPRAIVARNDADVREHEGLPREVRLLAGRLDAPAQVEEGGVTFSVDLLGGQKTGWFFDQRFNRDAVAALAAGARVLDCYTHTGAFALRCARAGAAQVTAIDRSEPALAIAAATARANGLGVEFVREEVFAALERLGGAAEKFDIVVCDPPAFVKAKKDLAAGVRGYGKLARLAAPLVAPGGFLFIASCSHHVGAEEFSRQAAWGISRAGREGRILRAAGAGPDHPVHPHLPESAYLKGLLLQLD
jgi:23S rRNA (cytosine1962-C5)-methyltransferase